MFQLQSRYRQKVVMTAHRGFSGCYPENTLTAFRQAVELGADIIEFDVRETADGVPVIMHDETLDRTTDGHGKVTACRFDELRRLNASYWQGPHDSGVRLDHPQYENMPVPAFEEVLQYLSTEDVGINIQVYASSDAVREKICRLYEDYSLYDRAYLMIGSFREAETIKRNHPRIEICVGEDRANLERHLAFGSTFIQPYRDMVTPEFCREIARTGLLANMFYSNTAEDNRRYLDCGIGGIMTDRLDLLKESLAG